MASKRPGKKAKQAIEELEQKNDFSALIDQVKEKPWHYAAGAGFVLLCALAGLLYKASNVAADKELATAYARTLDITNSEELVQALQPLAEMKGALLPEVLNRLGSAAFDAGQYEVARGAYERIEKEYPKSELAPVAIEGLGLIQEEGKDFEGASARYQEVMDRWPESPVALRQPINVARCREKLGDVAGAVDKYREQVGVFPLSTVASKAQTALARLRVTNPDLFEASAEAGEAGSGVASDAAAAQGEPAELKAAEETSPEAPVGEEAKTDPASRLEVGVPSEKLTLMKDSGEMDPTTVETPAEALE